MKKETSLEALRLAWDSMEEAQKGEMFAQSTFDKAIFHLLYNAFWILYTILIDLKRKDGGSK